MSDSHDPDPPTAPAAAPEAAPKDAPKAAETHFGAHAVPLAEKPALVQGVFSSVAARYDLMNDLMSARVHRLWKEAMIDWLAPRRGARLLDVAGGTGDIATRYLARLEGQGSVVVSDLTEAMLTEGRRRAAGPGGPTGAVGWVCADATALPFPDRSFDYVTIAFGLRNVAEPEKALAEARRVLKIGGRFLCLEFSKVRAEALERLYDLYSFNVIPALGEWVARDRESYVYLVESIRRFPPQERLADMMRGAGFDRVAWRNFSGGVAALHSGWRL